MAFQSESSHCTGASAAELAEIISIDKALHLLAQGGGKLLSYLENLMLRL